MNLAQLNLRQLSLTQPNPYPIESNPILSTQKMLVWTPDKSVIFFQSENIRKRFLFQGSQMSAWRQILDAGKIKINWLFLVLSQTNLSSWQLLRSSARLAGPSRSPSYRLGPPWNAVKMVLKVAGGRSESGAHKKPLALSSSTPTISNPTERTP